VQWQQEMHKRTPLSLLISLLQGCCYIMVDFALAASQNILSTYKLFLHTKTNIIQKMTNTLDFYCKHRFVMQPFQNLPLCSSTVKKPVIHHFSLILENCLVIAPE
jgi:hypothetical protein